MQYRQAKAVLGSDRLAKMHAGPAVVFPGLAWKDLPAEIRTAVRVLNSAMWDALSARQQNVRHQTRHRESVGWWSVLSIADHADAVSRWSEWEA